VTFTKTAGSVEVPDAYRANLARIDDGREPLVQTWRYTFTENAIVNVTVINQNGAREYRVLSSNNRIDKATPELVVTSSPLDLNDWVNTDVTFTFSTAAQMASGASYSYSTDEGATWQNVSGSILPLTENQDTTYYFRAQSGAGKISTFTTYTVKLDKTPPVLEYYGYHFGIGEIINENITETLMTNKDITVYFKTTASISPASLSMTFGQLALSDVSMNFPELTNRERIYSCVFTQNAFIALHAVGAGGNQSEPLEIDIVNINKQPPVLKGTIDGADYTENQLAGRAFDKNVSIFVENIDALTVKVYDSKGKETNVKFESGKAVFNKNGSYRVVLTDTAGNITELAFTVKKPNYALLITLPIAGTLLLGALSFLVFINLRNKKAIARLIAKAGTNDDVGQFVLYKKAIKS
jgi:hypothetical protein